MTEPEIEFETWERQDETGAWRRTTFVVTEHMVTLSRTVFVMILTRLGFRKVEDDE